MESLGSWDYKKTHNMLVKTGREQGKRASTTRERKISQSWWQKLDDGCMGIDMNLRKANRRKEGQEN